MDLIATLGRTLGFSFAAGVNVYATVAMLGLAQRFAWVSLPDQFEAFASTPVIAVALVMYAVEFVADKVPLVDSAWDALHTVIRPLGGALIAVTAIGEASPPVLVLAALLGGSVAAGSHLAKAGTRAAVNVSPEPFSNWFLSLAEDGLAFGLVYLALAYPVLALGVALLLIGVAVAVGIVFARALRRRTAARQA